MTFPVITADPMGEAMKSFDFMTKALNYGEDRRRREEREDLQMDTMRTQNEASQLVLRKAQKAEVDEKEATELAVALQSGDLTKLSPSTATVVNKRLEEAGFTPEVVTSRLKAATILKPVISQLAKQSETWKQQAASGEGIQQADTIHMAQDPNFGSLRPYVRDLFFDKNRFNDKDGTPRLHQYQIGDKTVFGMVDQSDPVNDVVFHVPSQKTMVSLNIKPVKTGEDGIPQKDDKGNYLIDDSIQIPPGIATTGRSNGADDPVSTLTLPELQQKTDQLIKEGQNIITIQQKALETELIRRSPVARDGVSKAIAGRLENDQAWRSAEASPELTALYGDPLLGSTIKNLAAVTRAFGGSPKEALGKAQGVIEKAQTLAADKVEGQDFINTFSGVLQAAGKNPENPYSGMITFFNQNTALIGKKGAVEAIKLAQTAIASDRKTKAEQRRDDLGWAKVEAIAARPSRTGVSEETKAANLTKRDVATRIRDAQRQYATAVKTGDPATINEAVDNLSYLNDQAKEIGVPLANIPQRRETAEEVEALRLQAVENLKTKRGRFGKLFNTSPSAKAVEAEMQRLRKAGSNPAASPKPALNPGDERLPGFPQPQQSGKAFLSGNQVQVNGQSYPLNSDGTVTISGKKYRVQ